MKQLLRNMMGLLSKRSWIVAILLFSCVCAGGIRLHVMLSSSTDDAGDEVITLSQVSGAACGHVPDNAVPVPIRFVNDVSPKVTSVQGPTATIKGSSVIQGQPAVEVALQPYQEKAVTTISYNGQNQPASTVPVTANNSSVDPLAVPAGANTLQDYSYPNNGAFTPNYGYTKNSAAPDSAVQQKTPERSADRTFLLNKRRDGSDFDDFRRYQHDEPIKKHEDVSLTNADLQRLHGDFNKHQAKQAVQHCKDQAAAFLQSLGRPA